MTVKIGLCAVLPSLIIASATDITEHDYTTLQDATDTCSVTWNEEMMQVADERIFALVTEMSTKVIQVQRPDEDSSIVLSDQVTDLKG